AADLLVLAASRPRRLPAGGGRGGGRRGPAGAGGGGARTCARPSRRARAPRGRIPEGAAPARLSCCLGGVRAQRFRHVVGFHIESVVHSSASNGDDPMRPDEARRHLLAAGAAACSDVELLGVLLDGGLGSAAAQVVAEDLLRRSGGIIRLGRDGLPFAALLGPRWRRKLP